LNGCVPINPDSYDVDTGLSIDYDQDGDMDVLLADANQLDSFTLATNIVAPYYALSGEARSANVITGLDPESYAITKVSVTDISMSIDGGANTGLAVELYLSSNGSDWELYQRFEENEIHNYSDLPLHTMNHFGTRLYWKILLSAPDDSLAEYPGASSESPIIHWIDFEYVYVELREYSRTSVAVSIFDEENREVKLIVGGTFYYPGWNGQLRAYDVTNMFSPQVDYTTLRTVTRSDLSAESGREIVAEGVEIYWDAGQLLDSRSASSRVVYTAVPEGGSLTRLDFSTANVGTLAPLLQDVNNDNEGLIDFVRGEGRDWKLGDINHSNPVVVGPPSGISSAMGEGYAEFKETWEDRPKYLYVGANAGMIHCFDVRTGEELWAFIPYNLVPKLKNMWAVDEDSGERYFSRDAFVDGTPSVEDVYIDADGDGTQEWRTVLICGQGPGQGSTLAGGDTGNFYFTLDITDPDDPQPLWEFTDADMGETWSVPVFGKVQIDDEDAWVCFMGSGYDNVAGKKDQGHVFYAVNVETGEKVWDFAISERKTDNRWPNDRNITRSIPGSPSIIDLDSDGYADFVYVGDLEGRMWRVTVTDSFNNPSSWTAAVIYDDPDFYPIITKPAVWVSPSMAVPAPRVYFGTGGDDDAPDTVTYAFLAVLDSGGGQVEWFVGNHDDLGLPEEIDMGDFGSGEKVWADPKIANSIVYFSTLYGNIESVDPCINLAGEGKLYGRYVAPVAGTLIGGTALTGEGGELLESMALEIKTRSAVTLGEQRRDESGGRRQDVYIQEYDSTIQKLEQPVSSVLSIKSWREVYKIIR
jgi:hypothetical protein